MKTWLTVAESAEYAGVSRDTIYTKNLQNRPQKRPQADRIVPQSDAGKTATPSRINRLGA